jgi:hypothetical protein
VPCFRSLGAGQTEGVSSRNVLIVALDPVADDSVRSAIARRQADETVSVHVVAPASHIGTLQWLTGAEEGAHAEAEELADRTAHAVDAEVETEVGDRDPLLAVRDALVDFPADEILVAGSADEKAEAELRRFGLPVARLEGDEEIAAEPPTGPEAVARDVTHGERPETPFVILGIVGGVLFGAIVLISLIAFLVAWLA